MTRQFIGFLCMLAMGLAPLVGCGDECTRSLSDYCSGAECPTYEEAVAQAALFGYTPTPCGDTRLVVVSRNIDGGGSVLYFDESDALVGAEIFGHGRDDCGGQVLYGQVPDCPDEQWWRGSYCIDCRGKTGLNPKRRDVGAFEVQP